MESILRVAAVLGVLIALTQLGRAGWGLLRGGVDVLVAGEAARARADRGDLTGMQEAQVQARSARRFRLRAAFWLAFWIAVLAVPPFTAWTLHIWAALGLLFLVLRVAAGQATGLTHGGGAAR